MSQVTPVVCAILIDQEGKCLLSSRPDGKVYAGWWEFPGGKMEAGETVEETIEREMREELGLVVKEVAPWVTLTHVYPHATVKLHFVRAWHWEGVPRSMEHQQFGFFAVDQWPSPVLEASQPIAKWLRLPIHWLRLECENPDWEQLNKRHFDGIMLGERYALDIDIIKERLAGSGFKECWVSASAEPSIQQKADGVYARVEELSKVVHSRLAVEITNDDWQAVSDSGALFALAPQSVRVGSSAWQRLLENNPVPLYATNVRLDSDRFLRPHGANGWIETV